MHAQAIISKGMSNGVIIVRASKFDIRSGVRNCDIGEISYDKTSVRNSSISVQLSSSYKIRTDISSEVGPVRLGWIRLGEISDTQLGYHFTSRLKATVSLALPSARN